MAPAPVRRGGGGMEADTGQLALLVGQLARVGALAEAGGRAIVRTGGQRAYSEARQRVPVRTGHLRSTIYLREDPDGRGFELGATAEYAGFVEFGTVRMPPRPFIGPAFDQAEQISMFALNAMLNRLL